MFTVKELIMLKVNNNNVLSRGVNLKVGNLIMFTVGELIIIIMLKFGDLIFTVGELIIVIGSQSRS